MFLKYCYLNGKTIELEDAKISVTDVGLLRGFGVFDYLKIKDGKPLVLESHLKRLEKSAELTNLKIPISNDGIGKIIDELIGKNGIKDCAARIVLTGGESDDGMAYSIEAPTLFILLQTLPQYDDKIFKEGVKLVTFEHLREMPSAKTNNYVTKLKLQALKQREKAFEILYVWKNQILEGATCNFFIFKKGKLITPKDDILLGTRRSLIVELAKEEFEVEERPVEVTELNDADEAFISSTSRGIVPVTQIDDRPIGNGKVGENTKILIEILNNKLS